MISILIIGYLNLKWEIIIWSIKKTLIIITIITKLQLKGVDRKWPDITRKICDVCVDGKREEEKEEGGKWDGEEREGRKAE